jgi:hypothetical protein
MSLYVKKDWEYMASRRRRAFQHIAEQLGKTHPITKMMSERAWGRNKHERGPDYTLHDVILETGALDGAFDVMNGWARDNDPKAQQVMLAIYPMGREKAK